MRHGRSFAHRQSAREAGGAIKKIIRCLIDARFASRNIKTQALQGFENASMARSIENSYIRGLCRQSLDLIEQFAIPVGNMLRHCFNKVAHVFVIFLTVVALPKPVWTKICHAR